VVNGEPVPKWIKSEESIIFPDKAADIIVTRQYRGGLDQLQEKTTSKIGRL
jgi:hypothetical protein